MMTKKENKRILQRFSGRMLMMLTILAGIFILTACAGPEGGTGTSKDSDDPTSEGSFRIRDVKYIIANIEGYGEVFAEDAPQGLTSCFWFQVSYNGEDPDLSKLKIKFNLNGNYEWNVESFGRGDLDTETKSIIVRGLHPWDGKQNYTWPLNVLPLGPLRVEVDLGDGESDPIKYSKTIVGPGEGETTAYGYIYNEDADPLQLPPGVNGILNLRRPQITFPGVLNPLTGITVSFNANDTNVTKGEIWLYNEARDIVAICKFDANDGFNNRGSNRIFKSIDEISAASAEEDTVDLNEIKEYTILLMDTTEYDENMFILESGRVSMTNFKTF